MCSCRFLLRDWMSETERVCRIVIVSFRTAFPFFCCTILVCDGSVDAPSFFFETWMLHLGGVDVEIRFVSFSGSCGHGNPFSTHHLIHRTSYSVLCTFSVISQVLVNYFSSNTPCTNLDLVIGDLVIQFFLLCNKYSVIG